MLGAMYRYGTIFVLFQNLVVRFRSNVQSSNSFVPENVNSLKIITIYSMMSAFYHQTATYSIAICCQKML